MGLAFVVATPLLAGGTDRLKRGKRYGEVRKVRCVLGESQAGGQEQFAAAE